MYKNKNTFLCKGYPAIWLHGKIHKVHVLVWEEAYGERPQGYEMHHKDFDKLNFALDNLELLTCRDHKRIHAGWVFMQSYWINRKNRVVNI